jgi:hypothetical protein
MMSDRKEKEKRHKPQMSCEKHPQSLKGKANS